MSKHELNCSWHFAKQPAACQDIGPNDAAAEHFSATPYPSLIREAIQNSLDVVADENEPLKMKFEFGRMRAKTYPAFYELRDHIKGVLSLYKDKAKPQYEDMLMHFNTVYNNQETLDYIKVSDFNTKGMDYNTDNSPFHAFVRAVGLTVKKEESAGGSFGFGKAAYFLMSPIRTILVSTKTEQGQTFFEGAASLCTHIYMDEDGNLVKHHHYGYYDNQGGTRPSSAEEIPEKFRRVETGTDIYIMGVDGSNEKREKAYAEMTKAALRHFWLAFKHRKLVVDIGDTTHINSETLDDLMRKHFCEDHDSSRAGDDYNPLPYYEAVTNANTSNDYLLVNKELNLLGKVCLYVWKNKNARDSVIYMRKQRMFIFRARSYSASYGYYAVFICTDDKGNKLLRSIEDPSHKNWDSNRNKDAGKDISNELRTFIDDSIHEIFASHSGESLGIVGLDDYLFVPEELIGSDHKDAEESPLFGEPIPEAQEEGIFPTSTIESSAVQSLVRKESVGKVVITTSHQGERMPGGELGGHQRKAEKKKKKGEGGSPDKTGYTGSDFAEESNFRINIPVSYRVIAQSEEGKTMHSIIIHTNRDVEHGQIAIIVGGEEKNEELNIEWASIGDVRGNTISNLKLSADKINEIKLKFEDNMKHTIQLTAYEFE